MIDRPSNYEDRHPNDMVLHPLTEIREWDEALRELGIQDSDQTPAEAIRELNAEIERLRGVAQGAVNPNGILADIVTCWNNLKRDEGAFPPGDRRAVMSEQRLWHAIQAAKAWLSSPSTGLPAPAPHAEVREGLTERLVTGAWDDARAQAIEECAKIADRWVKSKNLHEHLAATDIARLIRTLALPQSTDGGGK